MIAINRTKIKGAGLIMPATLLIIFLVGVPFANSIITSFTSIETGRFTLQNYGALFSNKASVINIFYTLGHTLLCTFICMLIAYPIAIYLRLNKKDRIIRACYKLPIFVPPILCAYALMTFLAPHGIFLGFFVKIGLIAEDNIPQLIYNGTSVLITNVWRFAPFMTVFIEAGLQGIDDSLLDAARDLGSSSWTIFRKILFPLSLPSLALASVFTFIEIIGILSIPLTVGGSSPQMLSVDLYNKIYMYDEWYQASALSLILFVISGCFAFASLKSMLNER